MSALTSFEIPAASGVRESVEYRIPIAPALAARSAVKRSMDLAGSLGGLILLAPLLVLVGLLVRLESRGPILFRQPRMGLKGRAFLCLKFRTMVPDAEQRLRDLEARNESAGGVLFKIKDDPRVTALGRFLRRTSLDELPQLVNVLRGEMSLVGPRPVLPWEAEMFGEQYQRRFAVRPGLTGLWQVSGRSRLTMGKALELDVEYVARRSFAFDLLILIRTVPAVLRGGAR
jgi:lipopolysaccharide/colanic/teichoic acid biosynthesis glycosyltransferase